VRSFKRWLDRSLAAQAVLIFLLGVGVSALFRRGGLSVVWVIQAALCTVICVTFVAVQRRRERRAAGTDPRGLVELSRRIRHRDVPRDPEERESMRRLVDDHPRVRALTLHPVLARPDGISVLHATVQIGEPGSRPDTGPRRI